jgi:predicted DNA-binding transcriptional regulator AlpA
MRFTVARPRPEAPGKGFHHLDRRADQILAAQSGDDDDLLTTKQVAAWFGASEQWFEIGRVKNYGPPFIRMSERIVRYRRDDVVKWLKQRAHTCTSDYRRRTERVGA